MKSWAHHSGEKIGSDFPMEAVRVALAASRDSSRLFQELLDVSQMGDQAPTPEEQRQLEHIGAYARDALMEARELERLFQHIESALRTTVVPPLGRALLQHLCSAIQRTIDAPTPLSRRALLQAIGSLQREELVLLREVSMYLDGSYAEQISGIAKKIEGRLALLQHLFG